MMPFALGIVSGKLFDNGYFHLVEIVGGIIFTFSSVSQIVLWIVLISKQGYSCYHWQSHSSIIRYVLFP
jgi:uncharacterized membrane protein